LPSINIILNIFYPTKENPPKSMEKYNAFPKLRMASSKK
jgi:hypothetical protein